MEGASPVTEVMQIGRGQVEDKYKRLKYGCMRKKTSVIIWTELMVDSSSSGCNQPLSRRCRWWAYVKRFHRASCIYLGLV